MFTAIYRAATPGERWAGTLRRPVGMPQLAMLLLAAVAGHAQTGPPRGPVITNALIAGVTTTSATIVWSTDIASTSQVILTDGPSDDNTPVGRTPEDLNLVTSHRGEIPGLVPNSDYLVYVVSRGDQGTASSTFHACTWPKARRAVSRQRHQRLDRMSAMGIARARKASPMRSA